MQPVRRRCSTLSAQPFHHTRTHLSTLSCSSLTADRLRPGAPAALSSSLNCVLTQPFFAPLNHRSLQPFLTHMLNNLALSPNALPITLSIHFARIHRFFQHEFRVNMSTCKLFARELALSDTRVLQLHFLPLFVS
mmetsp:Transcript_5788/g.18560  ORF Transcript_5788/g.18560 Transcript_5788/m.18560 type:complete len:135 (+) Transcript_5788:777-1181(+)